MTWRKWLVRGLVFSVLGGMLLAGVLYQAWTNPVAIRRRVLADLADRFPGALIGAESARLRLLGGISVGEVRLTRRGGLGERDFLYVPSATIYHDKEKLLTWTLAIRKVELYRPEILLVREHDGRCNLSGIMAPTDLREPVPTIVIRQGTLLVEDRAAPGAAVLEIKDVNLTVINDPLTTLVVQGTGHTEVAGPVSLSGRFRRADYAGILSVELPAVPVGPALVQCLSGFCPDLAAHLRQLRGNGAVQANLAFQPGTPRPLLYDVTGRLSGGEFSHARLPLPLEQLEGSARCVNGAVPFAHLTARSGATRLELTARDLIPPTSDAAGFDDLTGELDFRAEHLPVTGDLFARLPDNFAWIRREYDPSGPVSLDFRYRRPGPQPARKHWVIRPEGMRAQADCFKYPVRDVTGTVEMEMADGGWLASVDLKGRGGDRPATVRGKVWGSAGVPGGVDLALRSDDVPLDDRVWEALPPESRAIAWQFLPEKSREVGLRAHPMGKADVQGFIRRTPGQGKFVNRFVVAFRDAEVRYDLFPLELEEVTGVLDILPDHWECRDFVGYHRGGEIRVDGRSFSPAAGAALPGAREGPDRVQVAIRGRQILLDKEFEKALAPPGADGRSALQRAWRMLALAGRLSFAAEVIDHPGQPQDIDVAVDIRGCTMQPQFFSYALDEVGGRVRYAAGRVYLSDVSARHGAAALGVKWGLVELKPAGGFRVWLKPIRATNLTPDVDFLNALNPSLRKGLEPLKLRQPLDVETSLTFDAPPEPGGPLKVWWDGGAVLRNAALEAGVELTGADGAIACRGHHDGQQFQGVHGDILLERATLLGQPLRNLHGRLEILADSPDVVRLHDLKADLFGGSVGGEARLQFGPDFRYEVLVEALGVRLEQFGRHNLGKDAEQAQLQGPARASLHLTGEGADQSGLRGNGRVDVTEGKMGRLPLLLDLLKAIGGWAPDRTAFEQAHMVFAIEGPLLRVQELDLLGNAISLRGQGTVDLDGSNLNLDFSADWGRVPQVLPAGVKEIPQAFSDQLLKIKMRGTVGKAGGVRFEKELVPGLAEPIKWALGKGRE